MSLLNEALELLDRGWSVIPVNIAAKKPHITWKEFQERQPTEDEVCRWWSEWPDAGIAVVTGAVSGLCVVDCDNEEALVAARSLGFTSPIRVSTRNGTHFYFQHPRDGMRRTPRVGSSKHHDWPHVHGLDFRGDGGYALAPPSKGYSWQIAPGADWDDLPLWQDWRPAASGEGEFRFEDLDLSHIQPFEEVVSEWERTADYVRERFPTTLKIPTGLGNARNERMMRYVSECVRDGYFGAELRVRAHAFEREFFVDPLRDAEFEATVRSMEQAERRNHPERFNEKGEYIVRPAHDPAPARKRRLILMDDADQLIKASEATQYLIEPWLRKGTIVQVYGYSGHGKSLFVQHACAALAAGGKTFGPFDVGRTGRTLYMDFEMGRGTIGTRLKDLKQMHGQTGDRLQIWSPFLEEKDVTFRTRDGLELLQSLVKETSPDVVVLDTIRSAWPGMKENAAEEWARVNQMALQLRNAGLGVILVHHSNKPGEDGLGREAGSTNQLTVLETQIRITQVYENEDDAAINAAKWDGHYSDDPARRPWAKLRTLLDADWDLYQVMEVQYGKVREWTEMHSRNNHIGFAQNLKTGEKKLVSSASQKRRAKEMYGRGLTVDQVAAAMRLPVRVIGGWLGV